VYAVRVALTLAIALLVVALGSRTPRAQAWGIVSSPMLVARRVRGAGRSSPPGRPYVRSRQSLDDGDGWVVVDVSENVGGETTVTLDL
jgi:hypothetical protein